MNDAHPTPAQLAEIDQWAKHVGDHLDELVTATRHVVADLGPEPAAAAAARSVDVYLSDRRKVSSLLGLALVRLAQSTQEPT